MANKLNQSDLAELYARKSGMQKGVSEQFVKAFFDLIADAVLEEGLVKIKGFGTFKKITVADRESVNVNTGERFVIPGRPKITFTPDEGLKASINKPFASFETITLSDEQARILESDATSNPEPTPAVEESPVVEPTPAVEPSTPVVEENVTAVVVPESTVAEAQAVEESVAAVEEATPAVAEEVSSTVVEAPAVVEAPVVERTQVVEPTPVVEESAPAVADTAQEEKKVAPEVRNITQSKGTRFLLRLLVWLLSIVLIIIVVLYLFWPLLTAGALASIEKLLKGEPEEVSVEQVITSTPLDMDDPFLADSIQMDSISLKTDSIPADTMAIPEVIQENVDKTEPETAVQQADQKVAVEVKSEPEKPVKSNAKPEKFAMIKSDVDRSLSSIGVQDTVNYRMVGTMMEHVVQEDETLTLISLHIYGSKKLWPYIAAYNKVKNPGSIHPGTKIRIPILENR